MIFSYALTFAHSGKLSFALFCFHNFGYCVHMMYVPC